MFFRLKFSNFMQYRDTEFDLGPNLNVIIGPNGAGKSTIGGKNRRPKIKISDPSDKISYEQFFYFF